MSILSPILKTTFAKHAADLESAPIEKLVTNQAVARVIENQHSKVSVRGFTVVQDEPESVAGTGKGPTPTDYFVTSVALCENVVFARTAAMMDIDVQALETTATGEWDLKGLYEIAGADSCFRNVRVETRVKTASPVERVVEAAPDAPPVPHPPDPQEGDGAFLPAVRQRRGGPALMGTALARRAPHPWGESPECAQYAEWRRGLGRWPA